MIVFCDFDGTITTADLNDIVVKKHFGLEKFMEFENDLFCSDVIIYTFNC